MNKVDKAKEVKSTSIMLIIFGGVGILLLVLNWFDIIKFGLNGYTEIMFTILMGAMFTMFFVLGLKSLMGHKKLLDEGNKEELLESEILKWCFEEMDASKIDEKIEMEKDVLIDEEIQQDNSEILEISPEIDVIDSEISCEVEEVNNNMESKESYEDTCEEDDFFANNNLVSNEELFFKRTEEIRRIIEERYLNVEDNLLDSIIEKCYDRLFEQQDN